MSDITGELIDKINALQKRIDKLERLENTMAQNHGYVGGAWQNDPIRLGYSGDAAAVISDTTADAGANTLTSSAVPAGEIWILQSADAFDNTTAPGSVMVYATINSIGAILAYSATPAAGVRTFWTGQLVMSEGDTVSALFSNCTLNDDIYLSYTAVRVDIDL